MELILSILYWICTAFSILLLTASFLGAVIFMLLLINIEDFFGDDNE